jgi:transcriptional regulator with XRE-family HTH domain
MKHEPIITSADVHPVVRRLTEIRLAWGLPIQDVAKRIGCSRYTLGHIEAGERSPSFKVLARWAEVFDYDISLWPRGRT